MDLNARELHEVAAAGALVPRLTPVAEAGRLVVTPHPVLPDGQRNIPVDLQPGETLAAFLDRHVPGIASGAWTVSIGGAMVPQEMWARTWPKHGQLIAVRSVVRRDVARLIAMAALIHFSAGLAGGIYGAAGGTFVMASAGTALAAIQAGVVVAGSLLINKVLAPKVPNVNAAVAKTVYSLDSQQNTKRQFEPFGTLLGVMRVTPDLASNPYTLYEGDDQYLCMQLLGGINVNRVSDLAVGDTPLSDFQDVTTYFSDFPGMEHQDVPLYGNPDTIAGGELSYEDNTWVSRTGSTGARALQVDVQGTLYDVGKKGLGANTTTLIFERRVVGAAAWQPWIAEQLTNSTADVIRRTFTLEVDDGQYEVRGRLARPTYTDDGDVCTFTWTQLKTIQQDTADYSFTGRLGIRIKASGQLSGGMDTVRWTVHPKALPVWTGNEWHAATTFEDGACNPGALYLLVCRGIRDKDGSLLFGLGLDDDSIDIEGLKAFMLHCAARGYKYSRWITEAISVGDLLGEIALAGMGQHQWLDGSRPTVAWAASGQPLSGVVTMAQMRRGSFSTSYNLAQSADGIEASYLNRETWKTDTIRVNAPGVTDPTNVSRIDLPGVTTAAHAAQMTRYHMAQSVYQVSSTSYGADLESLDYRRMSMLSLSHDLTQWGFSGRLEHAAIVNGKVVLTLSEHVPALATPHIGLRLPGDRNYRVFTVVAFAGESDTLALVEPWPLGPGGAPLPLPGSSDDNPAHDTVWCYDFKATPGLRVRVTDMRPQSGLTGADVSVVPESDEFWDYVYNGTYVPAPSQSSLPAVARPEAKNLVVTEHINLQGDTEWPELGLTWDTTGACDHCQVWAALDGEQLRLVDGNALGNRAKFRISGAGVWLIEVRPFDASGRVGTMAWALHGTQSVDLPPALVDYFTVSQIAGGLRRFAFGYHDSARRPGNFLGVQIRYKAGDTALSVADWDTMTPLADADEVYGATLETTRPDNGLWTFGARTVNTAGVLSSGVIAYTVALVQSVADADQVAQDLREDLNDVVGLLTGGTPIPQLPGGPPLLELVQAHGNALALADEVLDAHGAAIAQAEQLLTGGVPPAQLPDLAAPLAQLAAAHQAAIAKADQMLTGGVPVAQLPALPLPLVQQAASQQVIQAAVGAQLTTAAEQLLTSVLALHGVHERLSDAGIYVDPATGTVRIYGVEANGERINSQQLLISALEGMMALRATTAYVDGKIAAATLNPADLVLFEGLQASIAALSLEMDSVHQTLTLTATKAVVDEMGGRLTTVQQTLDLQAQEITQRVTTAAFTAQNQEVQGWMSDVQQRLQALPDSATLGQSLVVARRASLAVEDLAEATLRNLLTQWETTQTTRDEAALATDLTRVALNEGLSAVATRITELAAAMLEADGALAAQVRDETTARTDAHGALAQRVTDLSATTTQDKAALTAGLAREVTARTSDTSALVQALEQLRATVNTDRGTATAGLASESSTRATAVQALTQQLQTLSATVIGNQTATDAALSNEGTTRAAADTAEVTARQALSSKLTGLADPSGATLATLSSGLVYEERQARSTAVSAVVSTTNGLVARMPTGTGLLATQAALTAVETASVTADTALGQQLSTLSATVTGNKTATDAALSNEGTTRAAADTAEVTARQALSTKLTGLADPSGATLATLSAGLVYEERQARSTAVSAVVSTTNGLVARMPSGTGVLATQAALTAVETASVTADTALGQQLSTLSATVNGNKTATDAALSNEGTTRAAADTAEVTARQALSTKLTGLADPSGATLATLSAGLVYEERQARSTAVSAVVTTTNGLVARMPSGTGVLATQAALTAVETASVTADTAFGQQLSTLSATVSGNKTATDAALSNEGTTRAAADTAEVTARQALSTKLTGLADPSGATLATLSAGLVYEERQARSTAVSAVVSTTNGLVARMPAGTGLLATQAALTAVETASVTADTALGQQLATLSATVSGNKTATDAALSNEGTTRAAADTAEVTARQALSTKLTGLADPSGATLATLSAGLVYEERQARSTAVSAVVSTTNGLVARMPAGTGLLATQAALTAVETAVVTADTALGQQLSTLSATVGSNNSSVQTSLGALSTAQGSQATQLQALTATVGGHTSSIALQANALAQLDGRFSATVTLRLDVNGRVAGFVVNNNGQQSDFVVMADRFAVALGSTSLVPFVLGLVGSPTLTLAGNFYADGSIQGRSLVVRSITANHLDVVALSAINANLGTVVAGLIRNAAGTNFINLDAVGSATAVQFAGGKFRVFADAYVEMDQVHIRRRNAVATGTHFWGREFFQKADGDGNWTGEWTPSVETVIYIDTSVDSWEALDQGVNQPFGASVQCTTSAHWGATNGAKTFDVFCHPGIAISVAHFPSSSGGSASPRLYLRVALRVENIHPNVQRFRLDNFTWSLFKL